MTTYKRQRVASFVSAQAHSPAPLAPPSPVASQALPVQSPQELAPQFQQHALQYFTCPPFHPLAISLPPFQHVPAAAYPTPFLTSTEYCATSHAPQPNYFPFHHPTVHQQQQQQQYEVIAFQPPPSSPPAAYHLPLPMPMAHPQTYSAPYNYPAASIYPTEPAQYAHPLPTPFSPPTFADPFSTTTATGAGFPFPMHVEPLAPLPYLPLPPLPHNTYAELPALTPTTATPDQLPTPRSDPCSPTLATAPLPFEMERQWSRGSAGGRLGTPFEGSFLFGGGGDGERSWGR